MQYHSDGTLYKAVHISGPTRNILGLGFVRGEAKMPNAKIDAVTLSPEETRSVTADAVKAQVVEGVAQVNEELGARLAVTQIQFVTGDTPSSVIYKEMAYKIARRLHLRPDSFDGKDE